jgi:hypothetical protein
MGSTRSGPQGAIIGGRWAAERMLRAIYQNRAMSPAELRTLETLRKDQWVALDNSMLQEARIRLRLWSALVAAGLTVPVRNAMGKTMLEWETMTHMEPAIVSMDGRARSDNDAPEFGLEGLPLPITHKDFDIPLRKLAASRNDGEPLDTLQAGMAGRLVAEQLERMLFVGGPKYYNRTIYGLLTHPDRAALPFGTGGAWSASGKTGAQVFADVKSMKQEMLANNQPGPYWLVIGSGSDMLMQDDYKAESDKSIRARVLEIEGIERVEMNQSMPADDVVMFQATRDVVAVVDGEPIQTVQWDIYGGFGVAFKSFCIQVPLIRGGVGGQTGIVHMSTEHE